MGTYQEGKGHLLKSLKRHILKANEAFIRAKKEKEKMHLSQRKKRHLFEVKGAPVRFR